MNDYQRPKIVAWLRQQKDAILHERPLLRTLVERVREQLGFLITHQQLGTCLTLAQVCYAPSYVTRQQGERRSLKEKVEQLTERLDRQETALRALALSFHALNEGRAA